MIYRLKLGRIARDVMIGGKVFFKSFATQPENENFVFAAFGTEVPNKFLKI